MILSSHFYCLDKIAPFTGLIFDCDGVLLDSLESNIYYYNAILARLGLGPMTEEQIRYVHMSTATEAMHYIVPEDRWGEVDAACRSVDYYTDVLPHLKTMPGLFQILERLRDAGFNLAICTNRTNTMDRVSAHFGFTRYFHPILTSANAVPKPHPEGVHMILSAWKCSVEQVVFIGDSSVDQNTAQAAGVRFWSFGDPDLAAELYIPDFWALGTTLGLPPAGMGKANGCGRRWPFGMW